MDKVPDQVSLRVLRISPVSTIPQMLRIYYMLLLPEGQTSDVWKTSNRIVFSETGVYWTENLFLFLTSLPQAASCPSPVMESIARSKASQCEQHSLGICRISGSTGPKNKHIHMVFFPLHCGIPTQSTSLLSCLHPAFTRTAEQCLETF